jgi:hypothetical protein
MSKRSIIIYENSWAANIKFFLWDFSQFKRMNEAYGKS